MKAREERKKKKIEKQIRRLERNARQLKPIEECEVPLGLLDEKKYGMECADNLFHLCCFRQRMRSITLSAEQLEARALLEKQWAAYKREQHIADIQMLDRISFCQQKALDELRKESEELYQEAIQVFDSIH